MAKKTKPASPAPPPPLSPDSGHFLHRWFGVEGLDDPENGVVLRFGLGLALLAVVLRFVFWAYTGRTWEDSLITVLHSENLMNGLGLTHYLGPDEPPLHGFTSPLSVLVPLAGDLVKVGFGLSFIRIVTAFAGGFTVLYAMAACIHPKIKLPAPLAVMVMGYVAFEHHQISWGMAGMETQMATLVLVMSLYFAVAGKAAQLGVSLGFCMLARPDFAFWTAIVGLYALLCYPRRLPLIVGLALAVYLPWILFTTLYYGSPVPNTMVAKGLGYPMWTSAAESDGSPGYFARELFRRITGSYKVGAVFQPLGPSFAGNGSGYRAMIPDHGAIAGFMTVAALAGAADALRKRQWSWLPAILFSLVYSVYYVFFVPVAFGWYLSPFVVPLLLLSARGILAAGLLLPRPRARTAVWTLASASYLACMAFLLPVTFRFEKNVQDVAENGVRKPIGLFLNHVMDKDETVASESLGYVGYYSRRIVYDWPGLCSRRVVAYNKTHPPSERTMLKMMASLQPTFLVLRYSEYSAPELGPWIDDNYRIAASFEAPYEPGSRLFKENIDLGFLVLARKSWHPGATECNGERIGLNPAHARALNCVGEHLVNRGRLPEAAGMFRKSVEANPKFVMSTNNLGMALCDLGDETGGLALFKKVVEEDPNFAPAYNNLGMANYRRGDFDSAIKYMREAVRCDGTYAAPFMNLAELFLMRGDIAEAERNANDALNAEPGNRKARELAGKIAARKGK